MDWSNDQENFRLNHNWLLVSVMIMTSTNDDRDRVHHHVVLVVVLVWTSDHKNNEEKNNFKKYHTGRDCLVLLLAVTVKFCIDSRSCSSLGKGERLSCLWEESCPSGYRLSCRNRFRWWAIVILGGEKKYLLWKFV